MVGLDPDVGLIAAVATLCAAPLLPEPCPQKLAAGILIRPTQVKPCAAYLPLLP